MIHHTHISSDGPRHRGWELRAFVRWWRRMGTSLNLLGMRNSSIRYPHVYEATLIGIIGDLIINNLSFAIVFLSAMVNGDLWCVDQKIR